MKNRNIKIIILIIIAFVLLLTGTTYAILTDYSKTSSISSSQVTGDIYMHFNNGNLISLTNLYPSDEYSNNYFEFTIDGKNTSNKNINYMISLTHGDDIENKTRIQDKFLDFKLVEVVDNTENIIVDTIKFNSLNNASLYTSTVPSNTNSYLKTYRLYMKINQDIKIGNVGQDYTSSEWENIYANIKVNVNSETDKTFKEIFEKKVLNEKSDTYIEEDDTIYLSGTSSDVDYNYVWYSGKLWRITAINSDGTMKMITDDLITTISYGSDENFYDISKKDDSTYTGSYIYQWLNEDFLDTLYNYQNIIVEDSTWNITTSTSTSISTKLASTTLVNNSTIGKDTPVGLLNGYEYYLSYKNTSGYSNGYLNIGYEWWLLTSNDSSYVYACNSNGSTFWKYDSSHTSGVRPSINLKSNIQLSGGAGTKDNPYTISGDKEQPTINTTLLNTRTIGEYVIFDEDGDTSTKELYRIVGIEDGKVKLNKNDYVKSETTTVTKKFSTSISYGNGTSDDYWDYYLNNTWYNSLNSSAKSMLESGTHYIKAMSSGSYKNSLCSTDNTNETTKSCTKTTSTWSGLVGLPRYGEMFASQQGDGYNSSSTIWLITPYSSSNIWYVGSGGNANNGYNPFNTYGTRPSINLKSNIVITGGSGTKSNPFTISLKS